jgi:thiol:disulfide interchange protein
VALFNEKDITLMVADWTQRDESITQWLASFGRNGVPLYVYYPPDKEPIILPQILTPDIVRNTINQP